MKLMISKQEAMAFAGLIDTFIGYSNRIGCAVEGGKFKCAPRDFAKNLEHDINVKLQGEGYKTKVVSIFLNPLTSNVCIVVDEEFNMEFLALYGMAVVKITPVMVELIEALKKANESLKATSVELEPVMTEFGQKWFKADKPAGE